MSHLSRVTVTRYAFCHALLSRFERDTGGRRKRSMIVVHQINQIACFSGCVRFVGRIEFVLFAAVVAFESASVNHPSLAFARLAGCYFFHFRPQIVVFRGVSPTFQKRGLKTYLSGRLTDQEFYLRFGLCELGQDAIDQVEDLLGAFIGKDLVFFLLPIG